MDFRLLLQQLTPTRLLLLGSMTLPFSAMQAAEEVTFSGTIEALACPQACGICCGTHSITDSSGLLSLEVGNAFVDLSKVSDDGNLHTISGRFYETPGQCGVGSCTLFAVETVDTNFVPEPDYNVTSEILSIRSLVINDIEGSRYKVDLSAPFNIDSATHVSELETAAQGEDCSASNVQCAAGTTCISYFGIAGQNGPEFQTCEIPCTHPGASCPTGQMCVTIADGPGSVCVVEE